MNRDSSGHISASAEANEKGYIRTGPYERLLLSGLDCTGLFAEHNKPQYGFVSELVCSAEAARIFGVDEGTIENFTMSGADFLRSIDIDPDAEDVCQP